MAARPSSITGADTSLAMAVVGSSSTPMLLLDGALTVLAASQTFGRAFGVDLHMIAGKPLAELGAGEWGSRQLAALLTATAGGVAQVEAYEMDLNPAQGAPRRMVVNAQKLAYEAASARLLLSITDVTDSRATEKLKDDTLREKAILLQELQHRVANSLQIIASVLLQSARSVSSDETRTHLFDAHNRVMSVAAIQHQLAMTTLSDVAIAPYFDQLCASIAASMIHDPDQVSLEVIADDSVTKANVSVSLGLIVTELVINALKHAFPGKRKGKIVVRFNAHGAGWMLSVADDGVGMPTDPESAKSGLGTSIVQALAHQLEARIVVSDTNPGTSVCITHTRLALVGDEPAETRRAV